MSLSLGTDILGEIRKIEVRGAAGAGHGVLELAVHTWFRGTTQLGFACEIDRISCSLTASAARNAAPQRIDTASVLSGLPQELATNEWTPTFNLELEMSNEKLAAIEQLRSGGAVRLQIEITLGVRVKGHPRSVTDNQSIALGAEQWVAVLDGLGFGSHVVVDVNVSRAGDAGRFLNDALHQARTGHPREAIGLVRDALEAIEPSKLRGNERAARAWKKLQQELGATTKGDYLVVLRQTLYVLLCEARHVQGEEVGVEWTVDEAHALIAAGAAIFSIT